MSFPKFVYMTKNTPFFSNFARFCTPKRCTHVQCLVLKNNPNYVNFWTSLIPQIDIRVAPPGAYSLHMHQCWVTCEISARVFSLHTFLILFFLYKLFFSLKVKTIKLDKSFQWITLSVTQNILSINVEPKFNIIATNWSQNMVSLLHFALEVYTCCCCMITPA